MVLMKNTVKKTSSFSLRVLTVVHEARMCHGLRHKDYQLYRQYCSRRIRRIRKRFFLMQGERRFRKKELTVEGLKDEKLLELPLMQSERCWAYAMQLKEESMQDPRKKFALRNKLRKAALHSANFERLVESSKVCDARTQLEVQGYSAWLQGTVLFELAEWTLQWNAPIGFFNKAVAIYSKLAETVSVEEAAIIRTLLAELEVQLRYCRHHLGDQDATTSLIAMQTNAALGEKLNVLVSSAREKQAATLSEVTWKKRTISVKHEKVRQFLVSEAECHSDGGGDWRMTEEVGQQQRADHLDELLMECKDAVALVREDLNSDPSFKPRQQATTGPVSTLHFLHSYLCYLRLRLTLWRNLALIKAYTDMLAGKVEPAKTARVPREQDVVRLFDLALQNLSEMQHLAGLEDDLELKQENEVQASYFKAYRCFHAAENYAKQDKWPEALVLYGRTRERINDAQQLAEQNTEKPEQVEKTELAELIERVETAACKAQAAAVLAVTADQQQQASPSHITKKVLADRLDEYVEDPCLLNHTNPRVLTLPPSLVAVPCKPLFFDLALNHIAFPSLDHLLPPTSPPSPQQSDKTGKKAAVTTTEAGGLSGLVKGLWGWGTKK